MNWADISLASHPAPSAQSRVMIEHNHTSNRPGARTLVFRHTGAAAETRTYPTALTWRTVLARRHIDNSMV